MQGHQVHFVGADDAHGAPIMIAAQKVGKTPQQFVADIAAHKVDRIALHALEPHPDVGLDVFHDVADVEVAVGVRQGGGDE